MKRWWFALGLAILVACDGPTAPRAFQSVADDSAVPESLRVVYRDDAARLALRQLNALNGGVYPEIALPASLVDGYYAALILVHNAVGLPARDSVVERYRIHSFPQPSVRAVYLVIEPGAPWIQPWLSGERFTGNVQVDTLMQRYGLVLDDIHVFPTLDAIVALRSAAPLNAAALARQFEGVEGLRGAGQNGSFGDGNDIDAALGEDEGRLTYSVGWGDCPAGCTARHHWAFRVSAGGAVVFLGGWGDAAP